MRALWGVSLLVAACACAVAQTAPTDARSSSAATKVSRQLIEQKEAFVLRMLSDSPRRHVGIL